MSNDNSLILHPKPAPLQGGYSEEGQWIWCGSVIQDDDGLYHMFASRWSKKTAFNCNWLTNSRIVRATSATPEGPYAFAEEMFPLEDAWDGRATHNPTIHSYTDDQGNKAYALFYIGITYDGEIPESGELVWEDPRRVQARANQRIGVATAPHPAGPWTRQDKPILEPREGKWDGMMVTNPAAVIHEDGSVLLYYKAVAHDRARMAYGVARADSLLGPYERVKDEPIFGGAKSDSNYEDAFVWRQDGKYHMIFNDLRGSFTGEDHAGAYAVSDNGIDWTPIGKAYSRTLTWDDGSVTKQGSFERPQLLMVDGKPAYLFAATADGPGGFMNATKTWNMVVPIEEVNLPSLEDVGQS